MNVTVTGDLDMLTSTIAAIGGGDVNVTSLAGSMDFGSEELFGTSRQLGFGVFTSGPGNVNVTAADAVDVDGSRIAAFDGGNVFVESLDGNVDAGSGGASITGVVTSFVNLSPARPATIRRMFLAAAFLPIRSRIRQRCRGDPAGKYHGAQPKATSSPASVAFFRSAQREFAAGRPLI